MGNAESSPNTNPAAFDDKRRELSNPELSSVSSPTAHPGDTSALGDQAIQKSTPQAELPTTFRIASLDNRNQPPFLATTEATALDVSKKDIGVDNDGNKLGTLKGFYNARDRAKGVEATGRSNNPFEAARAKDPGGFLFRYPAPPPATSSLSPQPQQGTVFSSSANQTGNPTTLNLAPNIFAEARLKLAAEKTTPLASIVSKEEQSAPTPSTPFTFPIAQSFTAKPFQFSSQPATISPSNQKHGRSQSDGVAFAVESSDIDKFFSLMMQGSEPLDATSIVELGHTALPLDDFFKWVGEAIDLEAPEMVPLKENLKELHALTLAFIVDISKLAVVIYGKKPILMQWRKMISEYERELEEEPLTREKTMCRIKLWQGAIVRLEGAITEAKSTVDKAGRDFARVVVKPLLSYSSLTKQFWEAQLDEKNNHIGALRTKLLKLEQDLTNETGRLNTKMLKLEQDLRNEMGRLSTELVKKEAILSVLHNEYRSKMDKKIAEKNQEKADALRDQMLKVKIQLTEAEETKVQHKKAMTTTRDLEEKVKRVEKESSNLKTVKAAREKELLESEAQVKQLKCYKEAHDQIKTEFEELQISFNDVATERDELLKRVQELKAELAQKAGSVGSLRPSSETAASATEKEEEEPPARAGTSKEEHLAGLKTYWEHRLKTALQAIEERKASIAWHDAEIARHRGDKRQV
ncbi:hypothetical protein N0V83_010420 [Neocucurbitaria cava]|uniref:Uncharacterized protein n=1 Tax=Neocucurbitaria cava TaxID=798079 RepID=A0A9W8XXH6_9PLEO|nr:hypothetical protein N0V83_010420 [Neocucurbitaria cava]